MSIGAIGGNGAADFLEQLKKAQGAGGAEEAQGAESAGAAEEAIGGDSVFAGLQEPSKAAEAGAEQDGGKMAGVMDEMGLCNGCC